MKRMFSLLLAMLLVVGTIPTALATEGGYTISFNSTIPAYSVAGPVARLFNNSVAATIKTYNGESGWQLNRLVPSTSGATEMRGHSEICINMQGTNMKNLSGNRNVLIKVRYYDGASADKGTKFCVDYNSHKYTFQTAGTVTLGGTGVWKEHTFVAKRPYFSGKGGPITDVRVAISSTYMETTPSDATLVVNSVDISYDNSAPVFFSLESGRTGNIFFNDEPLAFDVITENPMGYIYASLDAEYTITNKLTNENFSGSFEIPLESKTIYSKEVDFGDLPFGIYALEITFSNKEEVLETISTEFSCVSAMGNAESLSDAFLKSNFGINTHIDWYGVDGIEPTLCLGRRVGAEYLRITISRSGALADDGSIEIGEEKLALLQTAKEQGQKVMVVLTASTLSDYPNLKPYRQTGIDDVEGEFKKYLDIYSDFVYKMVSQYGEYVECWEIMNEYNLLDQTYPGITFNGTDYADILKAGYTAAKSADESSFVVGGAIGGVLDDFVEDMCMAGAAEYMDALSMHIYPPYLSDTNSNPDNTYEAYTQRWLDRAKNIRRILNENGATPQIWLDEFNYSDSKGSMWQFESVIKLMTRNSFENVFERMYFYVLEASGYNSDDFGNGLIARTVDKYGAVKVPGAASFGYLAVSHYNKLLAGAEPLDYIKDAQGNRVYTFYDSKNDRNVYILWNQDRASTVTIEEEGAELIAYDFLGNETGEHATGSISVSTSDTPVYVTTPASQVMTGIDTVRETVTVTGKTQSGTLVSAVVLDKGLNKSDFTSAQEPLEKILYINQCTADSEGFYSFTFKASQGEGYYTVLITTEDGLNQQYSIRFSNGKLTINCDFSKDGEEISNIADLTDGNMEVGMTFHNGKGIYTDYTVLAAMYKAEQLVKAQTVLSGILTQNQRKLGRSFVIKDIIVDDIDKISVFTFNNLGELLPLHTTFELK